MLRRSPCIRIRQLRKAAQDPESNPSYGRRNNQEIYELRRYRKFDVRQNSESFKLRHYRAKKRWFSRRWGKHLHGLKLLLIYSFCSQSPTILVLSGRRLCIESSLNPNQ